MIRAVVLASLVGILGLVLYVPSAFPPERLLAHLRAEHQAAVELWGAAPSVRILEHALRLQHSAVGMTRTHTAADPDIGRPLDAALARELSSASQRLLDSSYFRSFDALLLLAAYRLATLAEWLPIHLIFVVAAFLDGAIVRRVKAKEFRQHNPEMFAVHACLAVIMVCATLFGFVVPLTLHPTVMPCMPLLLAIPLSRSVGSFHRST